MMMASHKSTVTGSGSSTGTIPQEPMTQETTSLNQISGLLMQMNSQLNQQSWNTRTTSWNNRTTSWNNRTDKLGVLPEIQKKLRQIPAQLDELQQKQQTLSDEQQTLSTGVEDLTSTQKEIHRQQDALTKKQDYLADNQRSQANNLHRFSDVQHSKHNEISSQISSQKQHLIELGKRVEACERSSVTKQPDTTQICEPGQQATPRTRSTPNQNTKPPDSCDDALIKKYEEVKMLLQSKRDEEDTLQGKYAKAVKTQKKSLRLKIRNIHKEIADLEDFLTTNRHLENQRPRQVDADPQQTSTSKEVDEAPPTKRRADNDHLAFKRHALRRTSDYEAYYEEDWASEEEADQDDERVHEVHEEVRDSPKLTGGNSGGTPESVRPRFSGQGDQPLENRSTEVTRKKQISSVHSGHASDVEVVIPNATLSFLKDMETRFYRETTKKDDKAKENRQDSLREEEIQRIVEATLNKKAQDEAERRQETSSGNSRSHPQDEPKDRPQTSKTPVANSEDSITPS